MSLLLGGRSGGAARFGLSFVDVVSGGFGAAFLLFLIFATLPLVETPSRGGGSHFVDVRVAWDNRFLYLNLIVEHRSPNGTQRQLDLADRRRFRVEDDGGLSVTEDGEADRFWDQALATGVALRNTAVLRNEAGRRGTWLRLARPCPGTLTLRLAPRGVEGSIRTGGEQTTSTDVHLTIADEVGRRVAMVEDHSVVRAGDEQGYRRGDNRFEVRLVNSNGRLVPVEITVRPEDTGSHC